MSAWWGASSGISFSRLGVALIGIEGPFFMELGLRANDGLAPIFGFAAGDLYILLK